MQEDNPHQVTVPVQAAMGPAVTQAWPEFNVNSNVLVRLTDKGREILRQNHYRTWVGITAQYEHTKFREYEPPKEDEHGWSRWQLWVLMEELGPHVSLGMHQPFESGIRLDPSSLTADPVPGTAGGLLEDDLTSSSEISRLKQALEEAYGLLWTMEIDTRTRSGFAASAARKILLAQTDKAGQARGVTFARKLLPDAPWRDCPSTHCERRGECASPNECIVGERARAALTSTPLEAEKTHG